MLTLLPWLHFVIKSGNNDNEEQAAQSLHYPAHLLEMQLFENEMGLNYTGCFDPGSQNVLFCGDIVALR